MNIILISIELNLKIYKLKRTETSQLTKQVMIKQLKYVFGLCSIRQMFFWCLIWKLLRRLTKLIFSNLSMTCLVLIRQLNVPVSMNGKQIIFILQNMIFIFHF